MQRQKVIPLKRYGVFLEIKKKGGGTHQVRPQKTLLYRKLKLQPIWDYKHGFTIPTLGGAEAWRQMTSILPRAACGTMSLLLGPVWPPQLIQLPKWETSTQVQLLGNGGIQSRFPHLCSTLPAGGLIGTRVEAHARSFCICCLLHLKIKRHYW